MIKNVRSPIWANKEKTSINCEVDHIDYGWIPFSATKNDPMDYGQKLFQNLIVGDFGVIGDYVPRVVKETPMTAPA